MFQQLGALCIRGAFSVIVAVLIVSLSGMTGVASEVWAAATACDSTNFTGFFVGPDGVSTFAVTQTPVTWSQALTLAQAAGGQLATITDQTLDNTLAQVLGRYFSPAPSPSSGNKAWIGLYDPANSGSWCMQGQPCTPTPQRFTWSAGASAFTNYTSGQPNNLCTTAEQAVNSDGNCYGEPWVAMDTAGYWSDEGDHGATPIKLTGIVEWPSVKLDCATKSAPPTTVLPTTSLGGNYCTNSTQTGMETCSTDTPPVCPIEDLCTPNLTPSSCPASSSFNTTLHQCEGSPVGYVCPPDAPADSVVVGQLCEHTPIPDTTQCPSTGGFNYAGNDQMCEVTANALCPTGLTFDTSTGWCNAAPVCSTGTLVPEINKCYTGQQTCPDGTKPENVCYAKSGGTTMDYSNVPAQYCHPSCQDTTDGWVTTNDTQAGLTDKTNNGAVAPDGSCLGQIYIFNGKDSRCTLADYTGMVDSIAKLVAEVILTCTGAGAALAGFLFAAEAGSMAATITSALLDAVVNGAIDATMGKPINYVASALSVVASAVGGSGSFDNLTAGSSAAQWGDTLADAVASAGNYVGGAVGDVMNNPVYDTYIQQLGNLADTYSGPVSQGFFGSYSVTKCCYPDKVASSCSSDEITEASQQFGKECHIIGNYCSSKMLGICMTTKQTSCCFSSELARIMEEQGRPQLSTFGPDGAWGDVRSPNCRGFTPAEFQALNMGDIDFTEYITSLTATMQKVQPLFSTHLGTIGDNTTTSLQQMQLPGTTAPPPH